jgi:hypothetical protein
MIRSLTGLLIVVALSGCQYDRSFLQMSSDSGSPFLGLQLRVDARDSAKQKAVPDADRVQIARADTADVDINDGTFQLVSHTDETARFVPTASGRLLTSSVRYSLPETSPESRSEDAAEYEKLSQRLTAF